MSILIKLILYIALFFSPVLAMAQDTNGEKPSDKASTWKGEKDYLEYKKGDKYKGPKDWYGSYPATMEDEDLVSTYGSGSYGSSSYGSSSYGSGSGSGSGSGYSPGIQYSPQQIQKDRERLQGFDRGGGGTGTLPVDPDVEVPEPADLPDVDAPDVDLPDVDIDTPEVPTSIWKILLFIMIAVVAIIIVYLLVKNAKPSNKKVVVEVENDWNPEVISKTELELRLDEALSNENYRECVRIYFTFILKELIRKSWIKWKREKTNYHYVLEMFKKPNAHAFNECVRIYDLVWYGEYEIDKEIYELLKPTLESYYKSLDPVDE